MPRHHGEKRYCVLYKAGMTEIKYISHSSENFFGKLSEQKSVNDGLGGYLGNRVDAINNHRKSKHKWKKELKDLKRKIKIVELVDYQQS